LFPTSNAKFPLLLYAKFFFGYLQYPTSVALQKFCADLKNDIFFSNFRHLKIKIFRSVSLEKLSSSSEGEEEPKVEWIKGEYNNDTDLGEFGDDQRANMVSIMQQIPFGGSFFTQTWPDWLFSAHTGSEIIAQICRYSPSDLDRVLNDLHGF